MIRPANPSDQQSILDLGVAAGMFAPTELSELTAVLESHFANPQPNHIWLVDEADGTAGVAYFAPMEMSDRVWNLYMIAVQPEEQGKGRGRAIIRHVEDSLKQMNQRLLLVETSSLPQYDNTRVFYRRCGFEEEGRIRDFFKDGEDKITFSKRL